MARGEGSRRGGARGVLPEASYRSTRPTSSSCRPSTIRPPGLAASDSDVPESSTAGRERRRVAIAAEAAADALSGSLQLRLQRIEAAVERTERLVTSVSSVVDGLVWRLHALQHTVWCPWAPVPMAPSGGGEKAAQERQQDERQKDETKEEDKEDPKGTSAPLEPDEKGEPDAEASPEPEEGGPAAPGSADEAAERTPRAQEHPLLEAAPAEERSQQPPAAEALRAEPAAPASAELATEPPPTPTENLEREKEHNHLPGPEDGLQEWYLELKKSVDTAMFMEHANWDDTERVMRCSASLQPFPDGTSLFGPFCSDCEERGVDAAIYQQIMPYEAEI